ncbi:MAG: aminotransferase class IV [Methylococcales bacterium]
MALCEWPNVFSEEARQQGIRLHVSRWRRPPPAIAPIQAKASAFYMTGTLSRHEASAAGFDDALLLDLFGNVAEASGANIFAMIDGTLVTPPPEFCLNGITRQTVIELAKEFGVKVIERHVTVDELSRAQDVFVTGTAYEILPVRAIGHSEIAMGATTMLFAEAYRSLVDGR